VKRIVSNFYEFWSFKKNYFVAIFIKRKEKRMQEEREAAWSLRENRKREERLLNSSPHSDKQTSQK